MATIQMMLEFTSATFQKSANDIVTLLAAEMAKDGLIENVEQVTDRYLAVVIEKNCLAQMFSKWFKPEDDKNVMKVAVVRIDNTVKANNNK